MADQGIESSQIAFFTIKIPRQMSNTLMNDTQPMTAGSTYKLPKHAGHG